MNPDNQIQGNQLAGFTTTSVGQYGTSPNTNDEFNLTIQKVENGYLVIKETGYRSKKHVASDAAGVVEIIKKILND